MNFFEQQDRARKNSGYLILLMGLAVLCLIVVTTGMIAGLIFFFSSPTQTVNYQSFSGINTPTVLTWGFFATIALGISTAVLIGSLFRLNQLRGGGRVVAESMGGRLINTDTRNTVEKRLLNIVEEMAIASGVPVPPVYLLEDSSINAFAAGYKTSDAVIGVTQGCIEQLTRDQLQGVIAHEFSHILHGDMRINLRLVGVLHGILAISLIGELLLRGSHRPSRSRYTHRPSKGNGIILSAGIGFLILGYAGSFFGNLIKAAVSRQREFLADAAAVQYTRNPEGISGALKRIGGFSGGTKLNSSNACEFSHMYFCQGIHTTFNTLMATHPPLAERIKRIQPNSQGSDLKNIENNLLSPEECSDQKGGKFETQSALAVHRVSQSAEHVQNDIDSSIGNPSKAHINHAKNLLKSIPDSLITAAHNPFSSCALIYGLLLDKDPIKSAKQREILKSHAHPVTFKQFETLSSSIQHLAPDLKLPLIELALPALKQQSPSQYKVFKKALIQLITADKRIQLSEWVLYRITTHNLEPQKTMATTVKLNRCQSQCQVIFNALSKVGSSDKIQQQEALVQASVLLGFQLSVTEIKPSLEDLNTALEMLRSIQPLHKPRLLKALVACIQSDGKITIQETELLRAIADSLDCPMPPLL